MHDFAVFIGRFQPLHLGHQQVIYEGLKVAQRVIVLIGSADSSRTPDRNPFTYIERCEMFAAVYRDEIKAGRLILRPISDHAYNDDAWVAQVQKTVDTIVLEHLNGKNSKIGLHGTRDASVALLGYAKDHTSYYLKLFPFWGEIGITALPEKMLSATDIRNRYLANGFPGVDVVDDLVFDWLRSFIFKKAEAYEWLASERAHIVSYRAAWSSAPFPPVFSTVDAVVVQSGHVLLVERGDHPGKGLLAIPGGFVNQWERLRAGAVRELKEETKISDKKGEVPPSMLESFIDGPAQVFDAPHRSSRGRVITHAFLFRLPDAKPLWRVKGSDDAAFASWHKLADVKADPSRFFDDHYGILQTMIGI